MMPMPRRCARLAAVAALALSTAAAACAQGEPQNLPATTLQVGMHSIRAQLALTPAGRSALERQRVASVTAAWGARSGTR